MKTVFFDIDTQIDFYIPGGRPLRARRRETSAAIEKLNRYAVEHGIPVVSTTCSHAEDDAEFKDWPAHCVAGTTGQLKPSSLVAGKTAVVPTVPAEVDVAGAQQIILEKDKLDLFTNPNLGTLLDKLQADRYVVYGVVTEYS